MPLFRKKPSSREGQDDGASTEDDLVRRVRTDPDAFAALYQAHFPDIYRYCQRRLGSTEAAADATSQVFTQAWAALDRFHGGTFRGWLFTIARNIVVDTARRRRPQAPLDAASGVADASPNPEDRAMAREAEETLAHLLAQLPPNQRSVVELRLAGLSGQEVADILNVSLSAVKALQFRAYSRLRNLLTEYDHTVEVFDAGQ